MLAYIPHLNCTGIYDNGHILKPIKVEGYHYVYLHFLLPVSRWLVCFVSVTVVHQLKHNLFISR